MKRLSAVLMALLLAISITACGSSKPAESKPSDGGKVEQEKSEQTEQTAQKGQQVQTETPANVSAEKGILCVNYTAFKEARDKIDEYVLEQSKSHEVVSVNLGFATVTDLKILDYLLPLEFMGQSNKSFGKVDLGFETKMLQTAWAQDAELTYNQDTGYLLKGTNAKGNKLEIKAKFDEDANSLRLEGYKDGATGLVFEYLLIEGGYAAQYHYEAVTGNNMGTPVMGLCTYKLIFKGNNGSWARYDNVASEPESILGRTPDAGSFIDGAAHWFTVSDGKFTGNLNGKAF